MSIPSLKSTWATFAVIAAIALVLATPATATFPGKNGRIAFVLGPDIYTMNPDGSGIQQLTNLGPGGGAAFWQSWSPDGQKIVFDEYLPPNFSGQLWIMNADGTQQRQLLSDPNFSDNAPSFSPDGALVVFTRCNSTGEGECALYRADSSDGANLTQINRFGPAGSGVTDSEPKYSPDGTRIVFDSFFRGGIGGALYLVNADGSHLHELTSPELGGTNPDWSPDGTKIVFSTHCCNPQNPDLWTINPDGGGLARITNTPQLDDFTASWSPEGDALFYEGDDSSTLAPALYVVNVNGKKLKQISFPGLVQNLHTVSLPAKTNRGQGGIHPRKLVVSGGALPRWGPAPN
jgi:Tol biopolymer transport system component